jgi:tetratricopeptide (TPR) repeat protein
MKKVLVSTILANILIASSLYAEDLNSAENVKSISTKAINSAKDDVVKKEVKLVEEALSSLKITAIALQDLEENDTKKAKEDIEKALGKLEVILSSKDAPALLPIDNTMTVYEYIGSKDDVRNRLKIVKELLNDGKVQVARELLNGLRSELDIGVVSLPLATYPDALKLAGKYIHDEKVKKAKSVLKLALSTFDKSINVVPIPLIKTTKLLAVSSELSKDGKKEEALKYLKSAEDELDVAEILGYVSHSDSTYKSLHEAIKEVRKEIKGKNQAEKLFDKLKSSLKDFKNKVFSSKK